MRLLEYTDLHATSLKGTHKAHYQKICDFLARGDFAAAQVKKLISHENSHYYRAKLDDTNRLLFKLIQYQEEVCILLLEIIENHAYDKSRFLRGTAINSDKIINSSIKAFKTNQNLSNNNRF